MPVLMTMPETLPGWLGYIEAQHPKTIAMGLERVTKVRQHLHLDPAFFIITVGGTNGKGSTCAMLERIYREAGYSVGCYMSPHLLRYNERVRVDLQEAEDNALCAAFQAVENARRSLSTELTYFEFGTLAAVWHFMQKKVDMAILEVGLGGRLDAVNAFDPDCAIVTTVDMDHMDYLGNDRESIGYEKAGIFRAGKPAICGDLSPPDSLTVHADNVHADYRQIFRDFSYQAHNYLWDFRGRHASIAGLPMPNLAGGFQLNNAACAMAAVEALSEKLPVADQHIATALEKVTLAGRFQKLMQKPQVFLDVAHNPQAASSLEENLRKTPCRGRTLAVLGMLADKDIGGVVQNVKDVIDCWYLASIQHPRGAMADKLSNYLAEQAPQAKLTSYPSVAAAYAQACFEADENDRIIAFGSFFTVAEVMQAVKNARID